MQQRLFVYGTLLDEAQLRAVTGRCFDTRPAQLPGHRRVWPHGRYPHLVADPSATVDGLLLDDVDARALAALDTYEDEGRLYVREQTVVSCGGQPVPCWVYRARRAPA